MSEADNKISIWTHISQCHNGVTHPSPDEVVELSSDSETGSEDSLFEVIQPKKKKLPAPPRDGDPGRVTTNLDNLGASNDKDMAGPSSASAIAGTSSGTATTTAPFVDPIADFITELYGDGINNGNGDNDNDHVPEVLQPPPRQSPRGKELVMEKENNKTPTPGPSTSRLVTKSKKRVRFRESSSSGTSDGSPVMVAKRARRSLRLSSPLSESDNGNKKGESSTSEADSADDDDDSDDEIPVTPRKRYTRRSKPVISDYDCTPPIVEEPAKKRAKIRRKTLDSDEDIPVTPRKRCSTRRSKPVISDYDCTPPIVEEPPKKRAKIRRKNLRSSTEKRKKASEKEIALERLKKKMEARKLKQTQKKANKASASASRRDESNEGSGDDTGESDDDGSDGSESGSGSSPCPVVPDDEVSSSSAASDSSVATAAETDEEPDLGSGSEGEKDLEKEDSEDDNEEDESDRSRSSSDDEEPDDGQNDARCLLCKDLGSRKFEGRAALRTTRSWCKCGECEIFADDVGDYDLVCCKEIKTVVAFLNDELEDDDVCITKHPRFKSDVLQNVGYARAISKHNYSYNFRSGGGSAAYYEFSHANTRKSQLMYDNAIAEFKNADRGGKYRKSLRSFKYWIFDCINTPANQIVIPACVLARVRDEFEIDDAYYRPFTTNYKCPTGKHCRLAFDPNLVNPNPPQ